MNREQLEECLMQNETTAEKKEKLNALLVSRLHESLNCKSN